MNIAMQIRSAGEILLMPGLWMTRPRGEIRKRDLVDGPIGSGIKLTRQEKSSSSQLEHFLHSTFVGGCNRGSDIVQRKNAGLISLSTACCRSYKPSPVAAQIASCRNCVAPAPQGPS